MKRAPSASTVGTRRPTTSAQSGDTPHEDALRVMLNDDPNNTRAFQALAEIVRQRAAEDASSDDPLTASLPDETAEEDLRRHGDLAVWALAEELAGHPKAWYPLVELARLSLDDDHDGAVRRLVTASERDPHGYALAGGIMVLRAAELPVDALGLGVGHWRAREHALEVGRQLVLAALEANRIFEAKHHLESLGLSSSGDRKERAELQRELEQEIASAEAREASE